MRNLIEKKNLKEDSVPIITNRSKKREIGLKLFGAHKNTKRNLITCTEYSIFRPLRTLVMNSSHERTHTNGWCDFLFFLYFLCYFICKKNIPLSSGNALNGFFRLNIIELKRILCIKDFYVLKYITS